MGVTCVQSVTHLCRMNSQLSRSRISFQKGSYSEKNPNSEPCPDSFGRTPSLRDQLDQTQNALERACQLLALTGFKPPAETN